jgi:hypothetical protein
MMSPGTGEFAQFGYCVLGTAKSTSLSSEFAKTLGSDNQHVMTIEQIRAILHGSEPFVIRMVSGREYRVEHPDFAALGRDLATLLFTDDKRPRGTDPVESARERERAKGAGGVNALNEGHAHPSLATLPLV